MNYSEIALLGIGLFLVLMFFRMPIGLAMGLTGFLGLYVIRGGPAALSQVAIVTYRQATFYETTVLPLFIFMGILASHGGISERAFSAINKWIGHFRGGLAMACTGASAAFGAVCGSNIATAATLLSVALPEMRRFKYKDELSLGTIACGGNLGFIIPPSGAFVIYGLVTQESIGKLFLAGILPGILLTLLYCLAIYIWVRAKPEIAPQTPKVSMAERVRSTKDLWEVILIFILVMGGIYMGVFTATEGGAVGSAVILIICLARSKLSWKKFQQALMETGELTGIIFIMIIGSMIFSSFLTTTEVGLKLAHWIEGANIQPVLILTAILIIYILAGCFMDIYAVILVTLPIFYPLVIGIGYDSILFGVLIVFMIMIGCVTPPVGILVFAVKGMARDVPLPIIFRGTMPFILATIFCVGILILVPQLSLLLPNLMIPHA